MNRRSKEKAREASLLSCVLVHRARLSNDAIYLCCDLALFIFFPVIPCLLAASCVEGVEVLWRRREAVYGLASEQACNLDRSGSAFLNIPKNQG